MSKGRQGKVRLGPNQRRMLEDLYVEGAFAPHYAEKQTAQSLANRGLVVWEGQTVQITDAGRNALEPRS